jgi:acyl-CoA thioester hydrolase
MKIEPYVRRVNYYETDQMGIVHHSNYLRYFEEARIDFMRQIQCNISDLERMGLIIPNIDAYAKYLRLLRFDDCFSVRVNPALFTGVKMKLEYEITREGEICCTGYTTHCFVNAEMKPMILRHAYPELFTKLKEIFAG